MNKYNLDMYNELKRNKNVIKCIDVDFFFNFVNELLEDFTLNSLKEKEI